jgi:CRP-like cAMP-binding protein
MYRVESGCVRLQVNGVDGERQIVSFLFKGELFGYAVGHRRIAAEAVTETVVRCWSISSILALGSRHPEVAIELVKVGDQHFGNIAQHLQRVTRLTATDRVRWFFSGLVNCNGLRRHEGHLDLPMSRRDIADFLGLSAETLSRSINELETDGFLRREGRRTVLLHGPSLQLKVKSLGELDVISNEGRRVVS